MNFYTVEKIKNAAYIKLDDKVRWDGLNEFVDKSIPEEWCIADDIIVDFTNIKSITSIEAIILHRILGIKKKVYVIAQGYTNKMLSAINIPNVNIYESKEEVFDILD